MKAASDSSSIDDARSNNSKPRMEVVESKFKD